MRLNGFSRPITSFQVLAVVIFLALVAGFYAFIVPFLQPMLLKGVSIACYSILVATVSCLWLYGASSNPADPAILAELDSKAQLQLAAASLTFERGQGFCSGVWGCLRLQAVSSSTKTGNVPTVSAEPPDLERGKITSAWSCKEVKTKESGRGDEKLFCTICCVAVLKTSKHCRVCDKCVDHFDHHCRWLNNCVGKANYHAFFVLLTCTLALLLMEVALGLTVAVRCFQSKWGSTARLEDVYGSSVTKAGLEAAVIALAALAAAASLPLGELFCFHVLLWRKRLTTYDYVLVMRDLKAREEARAQEREEAAARARDEQPQTPRMCCGCCPDVAAIARDVGNGRVLPSLDAPRPADAAANPDLKMKKLKEQVKAKRTVRISAWKLAQLTPEEAAQITKDIKDKSSILRPLPRYPGPAPAAAANLVAEQAKDVNKDDEEKEHLEERPSAGKDVVEQLPSNATIVEDERTTTGAEETSKKDSANIAGQSCAVENRQEVEDIQEVVSTRGESQLEETDRPLTGRSWTASVEVADSLRRSRDFERTPRTSWEDLSRSLSRGNSARRLNPVSASEPTGRWLANTPPNQAGSSKPTGSSNSRPPSSRSITPRVTARVSGHEPYRSSYDTSMTSVDRTPSGHVLLGHRRSGSQENEDPRRGTQSHVRSTSPPLTDGRVNLRRQESQRKGDEVKKPEPRTGRDR